MTMSQEGVALIRIYHRHVVRCEQRIAQDQETIRKARERTEAILSEEPPSEVQMWDLREMIARIQGESDAGDATQTV